MHSSFQFIAGWNCCVSETDSSDMVTVPMVFVSSQLSVIRDMTEAPVFTTKKENPLHHIVAYLWMMQHKTDKMSSLS